MEKAFWNVEEVSTYLGVKPSTIYQWAKTGEIPHFKLGKMLRFKKAEINDWVENHGEKTIDLDKKAKEILRGVKRPRVDINRIVQKSIESAKSRRYNLPHGKPNQIKGLSRKEVEDGTL